ncbi:hypothetical protein CLOHAE12215_00066 [Clostridium haemolyticum]|nr:hypothetical protein CLOHAE12215_00042 [Clostridium haemolyticum]CAG7838721.1 hypothetical protein CLOHAE12215_00066 [Clostridium haemolyticum]
MVLGLILPIDTPVIGEPPLGVLFIFKDPTLKDKPLGRISVKVTLVRGVELLVFSAVMV